MKKKEIYGKFVREAMQPKVSESKKEEMKRLIQMVHHPVRKRVKISKLTASFQYIKTTPEKLPKLKSKKEIKIKIPNGGSHSEQP